MNDLTIISVVYNDLRTNLFDLMVKSVLRYTYNAPKFIICDNGGNNLSKYVGLSNFTIIPNKNTNLRGSIAHGTALNKIMLLVKSEKTAIIEQDCVVLKEDWDNIGNADIMAAEKMENIYHMCFMVFRSKLLIGTDFRPGNNVSVSRCFSPKEDVGWKIGNYITSSTIIKKLNFVDCKTDGAKIFKHLQSDEFQDTNGNVIASHFGRGSNISGKAVRKKFKSNLEQLREWKDLVRQHII